MRGNLDVLDFSSLQTYFESRYQPDQASLDKVRAELRVGRSRLGRLLDEAGMARRPTGRNLST